MLACDACYEAEDKCDNEHERLRVNHHSLTRYLGTDERKTWHVDEYNSGGGVQDEDDCCAMPVHTCMDGCYIQDVWESLSGFCMWE